MLSNTCKYAVRSVIYLAYTEGEKRNVGIKEISKELNIPTPFLGKIMQTLAKQKLLNSVKGPNGGFSLARKSTEITLMDIVKVIDGLDNFQNCLIGLQSCTDNEVPCPIHSSYAKLRDQVYDLFSSQTIASLVEELTDSTKKVNL